MNAGHGIELRNATKWFRSGGAPARVLDSISLDVKPGEHIAIMGKSGSGKSTLLNILGCLDVLSEGTYWVNGANVTSLESSKLAMIRNKYFGFVFQAYNLVSTATAVQNVEMPLLYAGVPRKARRARAMSLLEQFDLVELAYRLPSELSGGQQQRVAIARAIANEPLVILADEPTGNLDSVSGEGVMGILTELNRVGTTLIVVTHDEHVGNTASRLIRLQDGRIISDGRPLEALAPT